MWGDITYIPVSGAELKGTVVGVHGHGLSYGLSASDREFVDSKKKSAFGRLYDRSGKLVASTNKNAFSSSDLISESRGSVGLNHHLKWWLYLKKAKWQLRSTKRIRKERYAI